MTDGPSDSGGTPPKPIKNDLTGLFELPSIDLGSDEPVLDLESDPVIPPPEPPEFTVEPQVEFDAEVPEEEPSLGSAEPPRMEPVEPPPFSPVSESTSEALMPISLPHPSEALKQFSERVIPGAPAVEAAYPFSLKIKGRLSPLDQEKFIDLLNRENMGFREVDLELQLQEGKILLPRISEYAAVLVVQSLRDAGVEFELGPSDAIFSTENTRHSPDDPVFDTGETRERFESLAFGEPEMPITAGGEIPGLALFEIVETLTASTALESAAIEAERTHEYRDAIESLKGELRARAKAKGASGLIHFQVTTIPLSIPSRYRILALATAIRPLNELPPTPPPFEPEAEL